MQFAKGMEMDFWAVFLLALAIVYMIYRARKGLRIPRVRKIPGIEALDESIGRATEMNRPVIFSPGIGDFNNPQTFAAFSILSHVAKQVAQYRTKMVTCVRIPQTQPVLEEIVRQAYVAAGKADAFKIEDVRYLSEDQFGYASGVAGIMHREGVAVTVLMGAFWAEFLIFAEAGYQAGAIQIGGTANSHQLPFLVAACDYALLGEELYAASAYLTQDAVLLGTLIAQDWGKMVTVVLVVVGAVMATTGSAKALADLLAK
jgi:hypothetical protein